MTRLKKPKDPDLEELYEKAACAWLNTTWGLLIVLANREETEGAFTSLNIAQWKLLPILDLSALSKETLGRLSEVYDTFAMVKFNRIPDQFAEQRENARLKLDMAFLQALRPQLDEKQTRAYLLELYAKVQDSLESWIKGLNHAKIDRDQRSLLEHFSIIEE